MNAPRDWQERTNQMGMSIHQGQQQRRSLRQSLSNTFNGMTRRMSGSAKRLSNGLRRMSGRGLAIPNDREHSLSSTPSADTRGSLVSYVSVEKDDEDEFHRRLNMMGQNPSPETSFSSKASSTAPPSFMSNGSAIMPPPQLGQTGLSNPGFAPPPRGFGMASPPPPPPPSMQSGLGITPLPPPGHGGFGMAPPPMHSGYPNQIPMTMPYQAPMAMPYMQQDPASMRATNKAKKGESLNSLSPDFFGGDASIVLKENKKNAKKKQAETNLSEIDSDFFPSEKTERKKEAKTNKKQPVLISPQPQAFSMSPQEAYMVPPQQSYMMSPQAGGPPGLSMPPPGMAPGLARVGSNISMGGSRLPPPPPSPAKTRLMNQAILQFQVASAGEGGRALPDV